MKENVLKNGTLEEVKQLFPDNRCLLIFNLGKNPLHYAAYNTDKRVMIYLIDEVNLHPDRPSDRGITPLHEAALCGNLEAIRLLIERGADYEKNNTMGQDIITILNVARKFDLVPEVKKIIQDNPKISTNELLEEKSHILSEQKTSLTKRLNLSDYHRDTFFDKNASDYPQDSFSDKTPLLNGNNGKKVR